MGGCGNASLLSEDPLGAGTTRWSNAARSEVPGGERSGAAGSQH